MTVTAAGVEPGSAGGAADPAAVDAPASFDYSPIRCLERMAAGNAVASLSIGSAVADLRQAIANEGPSPYLHRRTFHRHRREWPALWRAIAALVTRPAPTMLVDAGGETARAHIANALMVLDGMVAGSGEAGAIRRRLTSALALIDAERGLR